MVIEVGDSNWQVGSAGAHEHHELRELSLEVGAGGHHAILGLVVLFG